MKKFVFILAFALISCGKGAPEGFNLPDECGGKCEVATDIASLRDAAANSAAHFSDCICISGTGIEGDVTVSKPLKIVGKNDGSSGLKGLTISKTTGVLVSNMVFSGLSVEQAAVNIYESSVRLENVTVSDIRASSLYGGRGIVVSGGRSVVEFSGVKVDNTDGTGLLINGTHNVSIAESTFKNCGFAGIWVQNENTEKGSLKVTDSIFTDNGAVGIEILGSTLAEIDGSVIKGISSREVAQNFVGDGIVVKNSIMAATPSSVVIKNTSLDDFERAGIIFDGESGGEIDGIVLSNIRIISENALFGVVVQNGVETADFRNGIEENPYSENDISLAAPLFIITTKQSSE